MPTVLRQSGFSIKINTDDHAPMHVHVWHQGNVLIVEFETDVLIRDNYGFNQNEERRTLEIVKQNRDSLIREWRNIHG